MSPIFNDYAKYYNLIYADKEYDKEVDYILSLIDKNSDSNTSLLDVGCGTGRHALEFYNKNYSVTGIDISEQMIEMASPLAKEEDNRHLSFFHSEIKDLDNEEFYDCTTSLFHVINYLTTDELLKDFLQNIYRVMKPGGVFIFDFWHAKGVLNDLPTSRVRSFENDDLKITRKSQPTIDTANNCVLVDFNIQILDKKSKNKYKINESHNMRYYYKDELIMILKKVGFETIGCYNWMTETEIEDQTWYGCIIAKKAHN
ncbi:MAG: class I SAM-dependent methyltransferase [Flavobacteriales bacterium]|jgi:SAM-dependent methyltransferase|nr:class I SAM-dependent methyltransferase [Flavobacteriales bacterium]MBT6745970.1 class I SAM-dependent methyltransferase [Flavobacteriales bacterium]